MRANVLVALICCTVAVVAFLSHRARSADWWIEYVIQPDQIEVTALTLPVSTTEENAMAGSPIVLTCRLDHVNLAAGVHRDSSD